MSSWLSLGTFLGSLFLSLLGYLFSKPEFLLQDLQSPLLPFLASFPIIFLLALGTEVGQTAADGIL